MSHDNNLPVNGPDGAPEPYSDETGAHSHVPVHHAAEPIPDPGLPAHTWRPTDVDPKAEKRAERQVAGMFIAAMISAVLFVVAYFSLSVGDDWDTFLGMGASTMALGVTRSEELTSELQSH